MNARAEAPYEGRGLYVFCFARRSAAEAVTGRGLAGEAPLGAKVHEEVAAICCEVPLHEWTGEVGEAHLKDLGWLGPRALRHEEVLEQLMRVSPVLPLRFGCLFSSAERLEELLRRERGRIASSVRGEREVMNLSCLVPREAVGAFEKVVEAAAAGFDDHFTFAFNGPWAPHSFTELAPPTHPAQEE